MRLFLILAAAAAGALSTLAHVHTEAWWLPLLTTAALATGVWRSTPAQAALIGWAYGTGWLVAGTWWLFISMHTYGGLAAPLAALAVLVLALALSGYLAAAMAWAAWCRSGRVVVDVAVFAGVWLLAELARGLLFTGFPWAAAGYAQVDGPLAALAPWVGVYGMGAVVAVVGALLAWPFAPRVEPSRPSAVRGLAPVCGVALLGLVPLLAIERSQSSGRVQVSLVQTAVSQDEKFALEAMPRALDWLAQAMAQSRGELVVAPETAVPLLPADLPPSVWAELRAPFEGTGRAALLGLPLGSFDEGYTNSVVGLGAAREDYRYDKHHLVPFGEFIPWGFRWFVNLMNIPLGDFNRGALGAPSFEVLGQRLAPNICYEDLFGEELARRFQDPARAPTVLVNVSNIAWFGDTIAIDQHLHISRLRSLELQRPMIRATNTGPTVVIDHQGRVRHWMKPQERGVLDGVVEGRDGLTPYARWASGWGLWPLVVLGLVLASVGPLAARLSGGKGRAP
jgi:apolipoprotein N-acyltransferase